MKKEDFVVGIQVRDRRWTEDQKTETVIYIDDDGWVGKEQGTRELIAHDWGGLKYDCFYEVGDNPAPNTTTWYRLAWVKTVDRAQPDVDTEWYRSEEEALASWEVGQTVESYVVETIEVEND